MTISIVICTRNRGTLIAETLESILSGTRLPDELLVIDQSDNEDTKIVVETIVANNPIIRYISTETRGLSRARNVGIKQSQGEIIAFTDDDVVVSEHWLELIIQEFNDYPRLALLFGSVLPPDSYDWEKEFIPYTRLSTTRNIKWHQKKAIGGIGANMSLRRTTFQKLGGFDEILGAGTAVAGCEDFEYSLRVLCHTPPLTMHTLNEAYVIHHAGARRGAEFHRFVHQVNGTGMGLFWAHMCFKKHNPKYIYKYITATLSPLPKFLLQILSGRKPSGIVTYAYSLCGFWRGTAKALGMFMSEHRRVIRS